MTSFQAQRVGYLRWIIASDYYDGAMSGVGERSSDGAVVWFRAIAWDDEQWQRVFAVAVVAPALVQRLVTELEKAGPRQLPFWLPGPSPAIPDAEAAWRAVADAALLTDQWRLVEAHDLLEPCSESLADDPFEAAKLADAVRYGSVLTVSTVPLIDALLRQIQSHAG